MDGHSLVAAAAEPTAAVIRGIRADQLGVPTPCREYDVRGLVNHLLFWGPSLVAAAGGQAVPPPAATEREADLAGGDWAGRLGAYLDAVVAAWGEPAAWRGTTRLGGPTELPADMVGGMVLGELVVHGWDLARATGQPVSWDGEVLAVLLDEVAKTAEQGRAMGVYGPAVPVPDSAPPLHRVLGLTGRNPDWRVSLPG